MRGRRSLTATLALALLLIATCGAAHAAGPPSLEGASWRLEQPAPPAPPPGVPEAPAPTPLGLVGDIEFWAPNRGVLITAGFPPTVRSGVWAYNGVRWHELSTVCGGTNGRIAWAGPEEFWTISDGRPGGVEVEGHSPPIIEDTLCRFSGGRVVESFASPPFQASSYQPMHAGACLSPEDCWFGGDSLPAKGTEVGAFQLHWNGASMVATPYPGEGHAIEDMRAFNGRLFESVRLLPSDPVERVAAFPPALHVFHPPAATQFTAEEELSPSLLYARGEPPSALSFLRLSAGEKALWAAGGPQQVEGSSAAEQLTVLRFTSSGGGEWSQLLGSTTSPTGGERFPKQTVNALAAEPGSGEETAWLALDSEVEGQLIEKEVFNARENPAASLVRISASGGIEQEVKLPSSSTEPGVGPKGAAYRIACPAVHDCWMATTEGWLFHLAPEGERTLAEDTDPAFAGLITERPPDRGVPQIPSDTLPEDDSGLEEATPPPVRVQQPPSPELRTPVPLLSDVHTRIVHGTTLELRFHLAVKARLRLVAKRHRHVVAQTASHTFGAGARKLLLQLNRKRWPTELHLDEQPLAPLPTVGTKGSGGLNVVGTSLAFPTALKPAGLGSLP